MDDRFDILVIASGSVTTTDPKLDAIRWFVESEYCSPYIYGRFSLGQEICQILIRLKAALSFEEVESRDFCKSAVIYKPVER